MSETSRHDGALRLADWGLIRARGADAAGFLHGQLTQDIEHLGDTDARLAGYCSAKGRLLASFVVWRAGAEELHLACSADLLPAALKRLSMFVLRAKCKLDDAGADLALFGLAGPSATAWLGDAAPAAAWQHHAHGTGGHAVRLPDVGGTARYLLAQPAAAEPPALPALAADAWAWLEARSGVGRVVAATVEQFVPQMINLELVGGVNFNKGCYPGQEVVARSQYRGTLKRRAFLFETDAEMAPGQEVYASGDAGQPAGMVANAARGAGGTHLGLIELKLAALHDAALHLGRADGPRLRQVELPYAIPADTA
jgi:hypothetical protein